MATYNEFKTVPHVVSVHGAIVRLDHHLVVGDRHSALVLTRNAGAALRRVIEPFKQGRHWWFKYPNGVELHVRRKDPDESPHVGKREHIAYRTLSLEDLGLIRQGYRRAGARIIEPDVARGYKEGVVERFYVVLTGKHPQQNRLTIEFLYHPGKARTDWRALGRARR